MVKKWNHMQMWMCGTLIKPFVYWYVVDNTHNRELFYITTAEGAD